MAFLNGVKFVPASSGTGAFVVSSAVTGYQTPASAGAVNGAQYAYRAESTDLTQWEIGFGVYTVSSTTLTRATVLYSTNSNAAVNFSVAPNVSIVELASQIVAPPLYNYFNGYTLSTAGSSSTFGISIGQAADSTNTAMLTLASAYTKTTGAWAVGSGNGSLDTGAIAASTWYHAFTMIRLDTGVVDIIISLSQTSPSLPTGYTLSQYIGSMLTDGSKNWVAFNQSHDEVLWGAAVTDASTVTPATSATAQNVTVPPNVVVWVKFWASFVSITGAGLVFEPYVGPDISASNTGSLGSGTSIAGYGDFSIRTSGGSPNQIKVRCTSTTGNSYTMQTQGWTYSRDRR